MAWAALASHLCLWNEFWRLRDEISQSLIFVTERVRHWASTHAENKPLMHMPKDSQILSNRMMKLKYTYTLCETFH